MYVVLPRPLHWVNVFFGELGNVCCGCALSCSVSHLGVIKLGEVVFKVTATIQVVLKSW